MRWRWGVAAVGIGLVALAVAWGLRPRPPVTLPHSRLVTLAHPFEGERPDAPPGAPNLVLVIGCTVRRDQTTIHGGTAATPVLQQLAAEGARFDDLVAAAPWTRAASTAILTGYHPISVGMAEPRPHRDERVLDERVLTLAEHLRANGYATAGLTTNPNLNAVYGFDQGFDAYRQLARLWREVGTKLPGDIAVREAVALLDAIPEGRPIYLQVVLIDAHAPFSASKAELARFADPTVPDEVVAYRAALRRMDRAVGLLDTLLQERDLTPENTLFVFTNDHGDGLRWPVHHGASHGRFLAPSSVGGVFVVRGPGIPAGRVVDGVVSQIDLAPTLVGLAGLPPFPSDGTDDSAAFRGGPATIDGPPVFTETWFQDTDRAAIYTREAACQLDFDPHADGARGVGFVDGCFDRRTDPDHAAAHRDPGLEQTLRDWRAERIVEASTFGTVKQADLDPATNAELEALGYISD